MNSEQRKQAYLRQTGRTGLTPAQHRRYVKKLRREQAK